MNHPIFKPLPSTATQEIETDAQHRDVFLKRGGVSQHVCEAFEQLLPQEKDISGPSTKPNEI